MSLDGKPVSIVTVTKRSVVGIRAAGTVQGDGIKVVTLSLGPAEAAGAWMVTVTVRLAYANALKAAMPKAPVGDTLKFS